MFRVDSIVGKERDQDTKPNKSSDGMAHLKVVRKVTGSEPRNQLSQGSPDGIQLERENT